jgi:hypothetical protein
MKRGLAGKPEEWEFEVKLEKLNQLKEGSTELVV